MQPKPTPRRRFGPPSPKSDSIDDDDLQDSLNEEVVVYTTTSGTPFRGKLLRYGKLKIVISPKLSIYRKHIVAFHQEKDAPRKTTQGPPVSRR